MSSTNWLDADEMRLWRNLVETTNSLFADLEDDLVREHQLTLGDYQVLVYLSEAEGTRRRMCDLAAELRLSPSGLTRRLDGLVRGGLVGREPWDMDRRVTLAVLTDLGRQRLVAAAPVHVASVRRHLLDHLSHEQIVAVGSALVSLSTGRSAEAHGPSQT